MRRSPTLHVIMPVYNGEEYIEQAIDSVINQSYDRIQLYIIDDGSIDNTLTICNSIAERHSNVSVFKQNNSGVSAARNVGIKYAISIGCDDDYIAFIDADDIWIDNSVSETILSSYSNSEMICFQACYATYDFQKISRAFPETTQTETIYDGYNNVWRAPMFSWMAFYRVSLLKKYGVLFTEGLRYNEDKIFAMKLFYLSAQTTFLPQTLYLYRSNETSAMNTRPRGAYYYLPIIDAWLKADDEMKAKNCFKNANFTFGSLLSSIYFIEMAIEHCEYFGDYKEIISIIKNHRHYETFLKLQRNEVSQKQYKEFLLFNNKPRLFFIKHRFFGFFLRMAKYIKKTRLFSKFYNQHRFPFNNHYLNTTP